MRFATFTTALLICGLALGTDSRAQSADCRSDDYLEAAMEHLESHYRSFPDSLFTAQLYLREGFGQTQVEADGKWGPKTERAMCDALQLYTEAGGSDGDWGIHRASHAPAFSAWLLKAARTKLSDSGGQSSE